MVGYKELLTVAALFGLGSALMPFAASAKGGFAGGAHAPGGMHGVHGAFFPHAGLPVRARFAAHVFRHFPLRDRRFVGAYWWPGYGWYDPSTDYPAAYVSSSDPADSSAMPIAPSAVPYRPVSAYPSECRTKVQEVPAEFGGGTRAIRITRCN
jgi:hypothetical protein